MKRALHRLLLRAGIPVHCWTVTRMNHAGRPSLRECGCCGARQRWNWEMARDQGRIEWEDIA